jgi:uncharacterized protein YecE (DUF72 family)
VTKNYHIGCQSWGYDDWITPAGGETIFYPRGTKRDEMLRLYSEVFSTIEVDSTLYGMPAESTIQNWYDETPNRFIFSLKFPREITHDHLLRGPSIRVMNEFVERVALLREKLGVMLIQFPASFEADKDNARALRQFLDHIPAEFRFAIEFRNAGWFVDWTYEELEKAGVSLALVEGRWVDRELMFAAAARVSSRFRYVRVMGERDLESFDRIQRHRDHVIDTWASELSKLDASDIYIYCDNYFEGFAPGTANKFLKTFDLPTVDPAVLEPQGSLF